MGSNCLTLSSFYPSIGRQILWSQLLIQLSKDFVKSSRCYHHRSWILFYQDNNQTLSARVLAVDLSVHRQIFWS